MTDRKILQIGAEWCVPCKQVRPFVEKLAAELGVGFVYVDMEKEPDAARWQVRSLPTIIFFKDGVEVARVAGTAHGQIRSAAHALA